jgi:hypothetical protein
MFLCWFFAFCAGVTAFLMVAAPFTRWQGGFSWRGGSRFVALLAYELLLLPFATIFGMAWRTVFMEMKWARAWSIAASAILLLMFFVLCSKYSLADMGYGAFLGVAGVLGLIAFARSSAVRELEKPTED